MATGHSLEHPADRADTLQGDYIESSGPIPSSELAKYLRHDPMPAGPARVIRAVRVSDTNPPFYYLIVWAWTRIFGTADRVLRLLSVMFALACFPLLWKLASRFDTEAIIPACLLFTIAPASIYYSTEGRMYSLVWFFVLGLMLASVELHERGTNWKRMVLWVVAAVGGLYTHHFFTFPFGACVLWLLIYPGRLGRPILITLSGVTAIAISPWYVQVPQMMKSWRITKDWLTWRPDDFYWTTAPFKFAWSLLNNSDSSGLWFGGRGGKSACLHSLRGSHDFIALEFALAGIRGQVPVAVAVDCVSSRRSHRSRSASPHLRVGDTAVRPRGNAAGTSAGRARDGATVVENAGCRDSARSGDLADGNSSRLLPAVSSPSADPGAGHTSGEGQSRLAHPAWDSLGNYGLRALPSARYPNPLVGRTTWRPTHSW